jgi:molecular chaperone HscC
VVITDVCPYTLGIEVSKRIGASFEDGHFLPILDRNVVIPASRVDRVYTLHDRQREVRVAIYQGEARRVKDDVFLGAITVAVPPKPAGEESIDVRFTYDVNGLLEVEATVTSTGAMRRLVIEESPGVLTAQQIEERLRALAGLKIHPREQSENRALMARADRLYEQLLSAERDFLGEQIAAFDAVLNGQNATEIERAREDLVAVLDRFDRDSYL